MIGSTMVLPLALLATLDIGLSEKEEHSLGEILTAAERAHPDDLWENQKDVLEALERVPEIEVRTPTILVMRNPPGGVAPVMLGKTIAFFPLNRLFPGDTEICMRGS